MAQAGRLRTARSGRFVPPSPAGFDDSISTVPGREASAESFDEPPPRHPRGPPLRGFARGPGAQVALRVSAPPVCFVCGYSTALTSTPSPPRSRLRGAGTPSSPAARPSCYVRCSSTTATMRAAGALDVVVRGRLGHHAHQLLGAGRAHEDAAAAVEAAGLFVDRRPHRVGRAPAPACRARAR